MMMAVSIRNNEYVRAIMFVMGITRHKVSLLNVICSFLVVELAVEYLQELVPRELGRIDMYWASSLQRYDISFCTF